MLETQFLDLLAFKPVIWLGYSFTTRDLGNNGVAAFTRANQIRTAQEYFP
jgi:hypothetical protein